MPGNIELLDRLIRIGVGLAMLAAVLLIRSSWRWAGLIGLLPLATGLIGWCPLYAWLARD